MHVSLHATSPRSYHGNLWLASRGAPHRPRVLACFSLRSSGFHVPR
ncbi:hypothetical protein AKJ09_07811 [Labilithrix luteola]|uniref:Uncharacterized protein n=1 Tax=Labilithrix luteola TaxID=1391654 RepID=A0A0K1Q5Y2_9BACT|nr:hypothetical protein AKJ09_07811 [Labilithrix luteola]